jgi:Cullin family
MAQPPLRPQTRKITIRNLRSTPNAVSQIYFSQTKDRLQRAIDVILEEGTLVDSLEELYRGVENLVRENRGQEVYELLRERCRVFMTQSMAPDVEGFVLSAETAVGTVAGTGYRTVEHVEQAWGKWTSKIVPVCAVLELIAGPHPEYLLLS